MKRNCAWCGVDGRDGRADRLGLRCHIPRIVVGGDAMLERYSEGGVDRLPAAAPVPVLRVTRRFERAGGAANVAVNLAALGAAVSLVALVGDDADGERLAERLDAAGAALDRVVDTEWSTLVKSRCVSQAGPLLRVDVQTPSPPAMRRRLTERFARALPVHDIVVLADGAMGALDDRAPLVQAAAAATKPVLVDPKGADGARYAGATLAKRDPGALQTALGGDAALDRNALEARPRRCVAGIAGAGCSSRTRNWA